MYKKTIDPYLVFIVMALVIFGVIMISSVSVYPSFKTTSYLVNKWLLSEANNSYFLEKTFWNLIIGVWVLIFFTKLSYTLPREMESTNIGFSICYNDGSIGYLKRV